MLGVGLIGLGNISSAHLRGLQVMEQEGMARCVAGADPVESQRETRRREWGLPKVYDHHRKLLDDPAVEAVTIAVPHYLHAPLTIDALNAGKHVLLEKPMAVTLDECDEMVEAERRSGKILQIGLTGRFHPPLRAALQFLDSNEIGPVIQATAFVSAPWEEHQRPPYMRSRAMGGGWWLGAGVHAVDWVTRLIGAKAVAVKARIRAYMHFQAADDTATAMIDYANGVSGIVVTLGTSRGVETPGSIEVHGTQGRLVVVFGTNEAPDGTVRVGQDGAWRTIVPEERDAFGEQYRDFVRAIASGLRPLTSSRYGRHIMEILVAGEESSITGREVRLSDYGSQPW